MALTDVQNKRNTFMQRVQDYKTALESGTQTDIDNALQAANVAGQAYASEVGSTSTEAGITKDQLFSRSDLYSEDRRSVIDEAWGLIKILSALNEVKGGNTNGSNGYDITFDDNYIYVANAIGDAHTIFNKSDWSMVTESPSLDVGNGYAISVDNDYLYIGHSFNPYFTALDKTDWSVVSLPFPYPQTRVVALSTDDNYLYIGVYENEVLVKDKATWSGVSGAQLNVNDYIRDITNDEVNVYVATDANLWVADKATWTWQTLSLGIGGYNAVASKDGVAYIVGHTTPYLKSIDAQSLLENNVPRLVTEQIQAVTIDSHYLYIGTQDTLYTFSINDWSAVDQISGFDNINSLENDNNYIYIGDNSSDAFYIYEKVFE